MPNRYLNTNKVRIDGRGAEYYVNSIYPDIDPTDTDYYVITTIGDRLDLLAYAFYNDSSLWWIIASANALPGDSIYPPIGMQLRIPTDTQAILANYNRVNNAT